MRTAAVSMTLINDTYARDQGYKAPETARAALSVDDSAVLLARADGARPLRKSRNLFKQTYVKLDNADKEPYSHHSGDEWLRTDRWCPEEQAGWFSKLFFIFANSLVSLGSRKHLEQSDLWNTAQQDAPGQLWEQFSRQMTATATGDAPQGRVWRALHKVHGCAFAVTGVIKLLHDVVMFTQPYILEKLLHHLAGGADRSVAVGLAFALLGAAIVEALTVNIYFNMLFRMSLHIKTELLEMLYRKSLRVSGSVKSAMGVGPIVNLQSNDAAKLWTMPTYLHMVWNGPFQVIVVMAMLVRVLSVWPALAGLAVTIAIIPLTMALGRLLTAARKDSVAAADQRIKLTTEVITGIKAIKLYAWEEPYLTRITQLREAELRAIRRTQLLSMVCMCFCWFTPADGVSIDGKSGFPDRSTEWATLEHCTNVGPHTLQINSSIFNTGPVLVSLATFGVYAALGYSLTAAVAFPSLALFNLLRFPIIMIPQQIMNMIAATVGITRIQNFMNTEEMAGVNHLSSSSRSSGGGGSNISYSNHRTKASNSHSLPAATLDNATQINGFRSNLGSVRSPRSNPDLRTLDTISSAAIQISGGSFAWDGDHEGPPAVLHDIQLEVPTGSLVIVVGPVGSGKSSLLNAVLGEMVALGSSGGGSSRSPVTVAGSVAYTAQDPWIQNATLRNNILMGLPFDKGRYDRCLHACCLANDLQMLPAGDQSEIGEKGINLSGGQKHRVALARAVYAAADVYLLDDPLSAVDVHVGRHLFEECISGKLAGKTRVLVTHQTQYLPHADLVVVMLAGRIMHIGTYQQLTAQGVDLAELLPTSPQDQKQQVADQAVSDNSTHDNSSGSNHFNSQLQQQQQQQKSNLHLVLESPVASHRSAPTAAAATTTGESVTNVENNKRNNTTRSHRGVASSPGAEAAGALAARIDPECIQEPALIELPPYMDAPAPGLRVANTVASYTPATLKYEFPLMVPAAADGDVTHDPVFSLPKSDSIKDLLDDVPAAGEAAAAAATASHGYVAAVAAAAGAADRLRSFEVGEHSNHDESAGLLGPRSIKSDHRSDRSSTAESDWSHSQILPDLPRSAQIGTTDKSDRSNQQSETVCSQNRVRSPNKGASETLDESLDASQRGRLIKAEERAKGQVKRSVYVAYLGAWGPLFLLPIAVSLGALIERGLQVLQNYILSAWSNATSRAQSAPGEFLAGYDTRFYLAIYFILGLSSVVVVLVRSCWLVLGSVAASRQLHSQLLAKMLRLPMSFYDSQPTGRLINRFTKDTEALDIQMAAAVNSALTCLVGALLSILVVVAVSPYTILALLPLAILYYRVQRLYIATSRELKRLDALAFSPIFQHYGESLAGLATIRAFGRQQLFADTNRAHIEQSNRAWWPIQLLNRWLSMRLELTGAVVVFITAVAVGVLAPKNAGLAGLALTSALNLTGTLAWMVRQTTELEVNMNSVERLVEYRTQPEEAPALIEPRPPRNWPQVGAVQAVQLVVKYRPELPPVLKGISFSIEPGEKIGICGRTGCGKSTLMMVLFRMVEPSGGAILIDGLETSKIGLTDLRSRLSLVPQDPVIFSGTVRSNLDPFGQAGSDAAIWEALRQAGIQDLVKSLGGGLDSSIQESGNNLSSGQRQLICMARALLRSSRILVLDEATSNVDQVSDTLIQKTIRSAFAQCTVLTIAHRLHTIADADRVMVLDQGLLREFDSPAKLVAMEGGVFRGLMEEASRHHTIDGASLL